jgi:Spy/CpxP family protein refolding chaperone
MHPALMSCERARRLYSNYCDFGNWPGCHSRGPAWHSAEEGFQGGYGGGGSFGVRRPLRFLAHKLDLDERQISVLARILDELKTERAQAEVDRRRTVAAFADALSSDVFDAAKAGEGGELRVQSEVRLRDAVLKALQQIHAVLNSDQRTRLAYLIRTGALLI